MTFHIVERELILAVFPQNKMKKASLIVEKLPVLAAFPQNAIIGIYFFVEMQSNPLKKQ